jgi:hypothetical protein
MFPVPLQEFCEQEWPPVEGECLGHYACRGEGYWGECVPRLGEFCGQRSYEMITRDHPGDTAMLARWKRADAYTRFGQARLNWLGKDHPDYLAEFLDSCGTAHQIRYGRPAGAVRGDDRG